MKYEFIDNDTMETKLTDRLRELEEEHFERSLRTDDGLSEIEKEIDQVRKTLTGLQK